MDPSTITSDHSGPQGKQVEIPGDRPPVDYIWTTPNPSTQGGQVLLVDSSPGALSAYVRETLGWGQSIPGVQDLKQGFATTQKTLNEMQEQIKTLKDLVESSASDKNALVAQLAAVAKTAAATQASVSQTQEKTSQMFAPILVPPIADLAVRLVPTNWLERLDEYRFDETVSTLLCGLFGGGFLQMLGSWVLGGQVAFPPYAIAFLVLLGLMALLCGAWLAYCRRRTDDLRKKMTNYPTSQGSASRVLPETPQ